MRKLLCGLILTLAMGMPGLGWGQVVEPGGGFGTPALGTPEIAAAGEADPCEGFGGRIIIDDDFAPINISNAFDEYTNPRYRSPAGDEIWLCFEITEDADTRFNTSLFLNNTSGLPVVISGLNIRGGTELGSQTLLAVSGADPVIIRNSSFTNCINCLSLRNDSMRVEDTVVACAEGAGAGIRLLGEAHHVIRGNVHDCATGIQIGHTKTAGNNNLIAESEIHHNNKGILVSKGQGNTLRNNSVYENDADGDAFPSNVEGIELAEGTNGGLGVPTVFDRDGNALERGMVPDVLYYDEHENCGTEEWSADAEIRLQVPYAEGEVEISFNPAGTSFEQGREFFRAAVCTYDGLAGRGPYLAACRFEMNSDYEDDDAVALFHHPLYGSSTYSYVFNLNPCPPGVLSASDMEAPAASGGSGSGAGPIDSAATIPGDDDSDDEGSSMAANPIGGASSGGGAVQAGGLGGSGAPGGGGCGGSINPNVTYGAKYPVIVFLLPLLILLTLRRAMKS